MTSTSTATFEIHRIKDGGAQMRAEMRAETVADYADDMLGGATFPAIIVFHDGADHWLADGFHRISAARKIGRETIEADIREGTARDAILYRIGSNASHGLRRTQADKRHAVERLLTDPEWARWSDRKVAEIAKVDHKTVGKIRRELAGEIPRTNGKPNGAGGSIVESILATLSDEKLVAECKRRGLTVAPDV